MLLIWMFNLNASQTSIIQTHSLGLMNDSSDWRELHFRLLNTLVDLLDLSFSGFWFYLKLELEIAILEILLEWLINGLLLKRELGCGDRFVFAYEIGPFFWIYFREEMPFLVVEMLHWFRSGFFMWELVTLLVLLLAFGGWLLFLLFFITWLDGLGH